MSLAMVATTSTAGGAVNVDFDLTVLVQVGLFLVLMVVLKPLLFDPMLKLFEEREKRIDGAKLSARKMDDASATALGKYEEAMQKARAAASAEREKVVAEGVKTENEILGKIRASTAKTLEDGRAKTEAEVAAARTALRASAGELARDLAGRVLGREVQG